MSKTTALNIILGVLVAGLLATLLYQETTQSEAVPGTTTTTTVVEEVTTTTTTTVVPETTTTTTTTTTEVPIPSTSVAPTERFFTGVLVVNGTSVGERIPPVLERLTNTGYFDVRGVVGAVAAQETVIYYVEPFLGEAQVVAQDLGYELTEIPILPSTESPPVAGVGVAKVIVYLGPGELPPAPVLPEIDEVVEI